MEEGTLRLRGILSKKEFQAVFMLILNSFSWYFPLFFFLTDTVERLQLGYVASLTVFGLHFAGIAVFAFLGNLLADRYGRNKLLAFWFLAGVGASASMILVNPIQQSLLYPVSFCLGISLGLGFPSCLAFFADHSIARNRGLLGGITFAFTFLGIVIIGAVTAITAFSTSVLVFTLWRLVGLIFFVYLRQEEKTNQRKIKYISIVEQKPFILYLVPWITFCLINFFQAPFFDTQLQQYYVSTNTNLSYLISIGEFGIGGVSALIAGYFSDIIGRKRLIIAAYVMVGIGYAMLSLAYAIPFVFYVYVLLDGIAWGIFMLMFFLLVWGDLAEGHNINRYYLLGNLPFILSSFLPTIVAPYIGVVPPFAAFSLASFFLFIAVIPLIYAPETLPEKAMKDRELKSYAAQAMQKVQKEAGKNKKKKDKDTKEENETDKEEAEENQKEYEEAQKQAEKYY
jgi:MFS family permease